MLRDYITSYADHPNQLKYNGNLFTASFAGDNCTFGADFPADGWQTQFINQLTSDKPAFSSDPNSFKSFDNFIDSVYNWNSGWPVELTTQTATMLQPLRGPLTPSPNSTIPNNLVGSIRPDGTYLSGLDQMPSDSKTYLAAVSPWFFTHYGLDSFNKNVCTLQHSSTSPSHLTTVFSGSTCLTTTCTTNAGRRSSPVTA